jgi:rod shape-determining protein MreC
MAPGAAAETAVMLFLGSGWPRVAVQLRTLIDRSALGLLVALSVLLLLLGKADVKLANIVVEQLDDAAVPILRLLNEPLSAARAGVDKLGEMLAVYEENARLREENRRLLAWQAEAAKLAVQNKALRQMLQVPPVERAPSWTTARIVADSGGVFVHTLLLDAGADRGIIDGMPAVNQQGLVGRIIDVGRNSARVLLITDFNSRVPVVVERSGDQALLEGDNTLEPALRFLPINPSFEIGDRVMTSGRGGLVPPGLLVGQISAITDGKIAVRPYVDWARLDYLSLLRYEGVLPPEPGDADRPKRPREAGAPAS